MVGTVTNRRADFFPDRINQYVKAMKYDADVHDDGIYKVHMGANIAADPDGIVDGVTVTGGVTIASSAFNGVLCNNAEYKADAPFGRAVSIVFSAAGAPVVQIKGFDYLGQSMQENITGNGVTPVNGKKAFKRVTSIVVAAGVTGTIDVGPLNILGLPYKTLAIDQEIADGALQAAGTFVAPVLTDPQTATTGDPRGTYVPTATPDGSIDLVLVARADNWVNAAGNGGYHGISQFAAT